MLTKDKVTIILSVKSEASSDGQLPPKVVSMSCERRCLRECKMEFTSIFDVSENHVQEDVPNEHCYDKSHTESMTDEDRGICEDLTSKAEKQTVLQL